MKYHVNNILEVYYSILYTWEFPLHACFTQESNKWKSKNKAYFLWEFIICIELQKCWFESFYHV